MRILPTAAALLSAALVFSGTAYGVINPNFTPVDLARQAELILVLELEPPGDGGTVASTTRRCLKGEAPARPPVFETRPAGDRDTARAAAALLGEDDRRLAVLVRGKDEKGAAVTCLHVAGRWVRLQPAADGAWAVGDLDTTQMPAVWDGGTDMLVRIIDQILESPRLRVPVAAGCFWSDDQQKLATIDGTTHALRSIDLEGDGRPALYVAADGGDRVFRYDAETNTFDDITGAAGLASKSTQAVWADFDGNGRLDLASWDAAALNVWYQNAAGKFARSAVDAAPAGACLGLEVLSADASRRPSLVWSGPSGPQWLAADPDGDWTLQEKFRVPEAARETLGEPGRCLVADFDGDSWTDVLWTGSAGSLRFAGRPDGGFEPPSTCAVAVGPGGGAATLGDFDADGLFDVLTVAGRRCGVWQNRGAGRFEETFHQSGELPHVYAGGGRGANVCDFNNDGRQDLFLAFDSSRPLLFFNRGFRSFGHAHSLDMVERRRLPQSHHGQEAGLVADLDGDGAEDLALVLPDGALWVVFRDWRAQPLAARAALPLGGDFAGPLRVIGWDGSRCLGAWNVAAGTSEAFFGKTSKGPLRLTWRLPGGQQRSTQVIVLRPTRTVLPVE